MTTNGTGDDISSRTTTTAFPNNSSPKIASLSREKIVLISVVSVYIVVFLIAVIVCCCKMCRCSNADKAHRERKGIERCELYQNSTMKRDRLTDDSLQTILNRPLPQPPEANRKSAGTPTVIEDGYEQPIRADSIWLRHMEEIRKLPPAPPVFPRHLERLPLDGAGAYIRVISDDEAPLLSPGPMHEITHKQQLCDPSEESGYVVPKLLLGTSPQQIVTETDHSTETKEIKHKRNEYQMELSSVVTPHGTVEKSPIMSESRSFSEGVSVRSITGNKTEMSKDTESKIFRSSIQLQLSPRT